jgi:hypothetical protein
MCPEYFCESLGIYTRNEADGHCVTPEKLHRLYADRTTEISTARVTELAVKTACQLEPVAAVHMGQKGNHATTCARDSGQ